jgi:hypothetical protein
VGKLINEGWYSCSDDIPQPVGIVMGRNLRAKPDNNSQKRKLAAPKTKVNKQSPKK